MLEHLDKNISVFRDDLYPHLLGGNKARKMMGILPVLTERKTQAIVTTGGIQSNHCRVTAVYCRKFDLACTLVLHGDSDEFKRQSGNAKIMRDSGAEIIFCEADEIGPTMDQAINSYKLEGLNAFYLPGGGHTLEGASTYIPLIEELFQKESVPDYIFLASGTGSTQAGILAGLRKQGLSTQVIGISIGRKQKRAEEVTRNFYKALCAREGILYKCEDVKITDEFLCGGYEKYNPKIKALSDKSIYHFNLIMDTTYTAKAFYGMQQLMNSMPPETKAIFWYTGGLYNYLSK